ncbi:hypothetical protein CPB85DRAFT_920280 [Mucidula mucida]|nr:hypothetical protein CPB85DRAFT_920280 [Mucidula mucida]
MKTTKHPPPYSTMQADNIAYQREDALIGGLNYIPYFEPEVDINDRTAVIEYCDMLYEKRIEAQTAPIYGGWSFIANITPFPSDTPPSDGARLLPHFARMGGCLRFTIIEGLQPMEEYGKATFRHSQVWVASVTDAQTNGGHDDDAEETVVLKIVQPSLV